ncbi:MAG: Glu-tRNA(Gln) amidotransferase subunit GatD [Aigarchaeota archaeon]|nr:Glu-tRNA(Gln) amidotransferase subunit GatD [Aigarchaeota archaeon]MDW8092348.1 Glu-tRNA(Gln) amidotransferase subunit GatD [Nitrososphaerota archaeon]
MSEVEVAGYRGRLAEVLRRENVEVGDEVEVILPDGRRFAGRLMAKYENSPPDFISLKIRSGYNVGVHLPEGSRVIKLREGTAPAFRRPPPPVQDPSLPHVTIISTGGTIASRIDYGTGAVKPALSSEDLVSLIPEITDVAHINAEILFSIFSEDMTPEMWDTIAAKVNGLIKNGVDGVVITHGTDTMHYTAAALSFVLQNPPVPVVLVGAQRSSDRPSSDAATNLIAAVSIGARAPFGEVVLSMHEGHGDDLIVVHRGTRVKKMHTSSRDAFRSVNSAPLAYYRGGELILVERGLNPRGSDRYSFYPGFSDEAVLIKFFPPMKPDILEHYASKGVRGIIIEGTGLGHVSSSWIPTLRRIIRDGIFVGMTSQCVYGRVNMNVYSNGRRLLSIGVTPLDDMISEVALVKLMWVLRRASELDEVKGLMIRRIAGEMNDRSLPTRVSWIGD